MEYHQNCEHEKTLKTLRNYSRKSNCSACPGTPTITSVSNPIYSACESPASVEIEYSAASGTVTMYEAVCDSTNGGSRASATSQTLSVRVSGLSLGKTYTCRVTAMNKAGSGAQSSPSSVITPVYVGKMTKMCNFFFS